LIAGPISTFLVEPVANFDFLGARYEVIDKLGINAFLHDDAAGRGAALSGGAERAPDAASMRGRGWRRRARSSDSCREFERTVLEALWPPSRLRFCDL